MELAFEVSTRFGVSPEVVYHAWLNSKQHSEMTGGAASVSDEIGGRFEAWDGYISGTNLALEPGRRIVQSWRTVEFQESEGNSQVEILLTEIPGGTELTLRHTQLPPHGEQYRQGWEDHYFTPMRAWFSR